jgi:hypothetical protein
MTDFNRTNKLLDYDPAKFVCGSVVGSVGRKIEGHRFFDRLKPEGSRNSEPRIVSAAAHGGSSSFDGRKIDTSWLPAAAKAYHISDQLSDYVISDVPILTTPIPNKNMQTFAYRELTTFDPMLHDMVYKTFARSAMHWEHENRDPTKAKGVIFDVVLIPVPKYGIAKVSILIGCDRTKDPDLAKDILTRKRDGWSMGAIVKAFVDSVTGRVVPQEGGEYKRGQMVKVGDKVKLCHHFCTGSNFFETSSVANPADVTAHGDMMGVLTSV